ncbi:hypothetical protein GCM10009693_21920 [Leucobacter chromiireducens subsp. chromiireducens]
MGIVSASQIAASDVTEAEVRPRSTCEMKPFVSPVKSATLLSVMPRSSRATRSRNPICSSCAEAAGRGGLAAVVRSVMGLPDSCSAGPCAPPCVYPARIFPLTKPEPGV